jgi:hypothetical protein
MNPSVPLLPAGFEDLTCHVEYWARETIEQRIHARATASMSEIRAFYDAMTGRAEAALQYVEQFPLQQMPDDAARLFRLVLALGQAHVAVEIHGQPRAPGTPYPSGIRILRGPAPFG